MPSYRSFLIGFFLAVISVVPLTQAVGEIYRGEHPRFLEIFTQTPTAANLRAYEHELEHASVLGEAVRPWTQYLYFAALRNTGEKALLGRDGWFFYKPDMRYLVESCRFDEQGSQGAPLPSIVAFRDQLARRGIHLLVVPIPGKPSVYPDQMTCRAGIQNDPAFSHTRELITRLRAAGVETVDLFAAFAGWRNEQHNDGAQPYYLMRDTHWSGATARRSAELVAARIRALGWAPSGSAEYAVKPVSIRRRGDVIRMMDVPQLDKFFPPELVRCDQVVSKATGRLYKDDPQAPVLVLGDSFFRIYETDEPRAAGFIAHLARELHSPLASIVNDGGASTLVRQQLSRTPGLLAGKKLVIWEFVERDIRFGADGWQNVPLPADQFAANFGRPQ